MERRGHRAWVGALVVLMLAGIARAAVIMPVFGPKSRVTELNSLENDVATWVSDDGLKVVLHSRRNGRDELFSAARASTAVPFSTPSSAEFALNNMPGDVVHGVLSPNGLELFYSDHSRSTPRRIMRATRANTASPFSAGAPEAALQFPNGAYPSYLSTDGLRLYLFKPLESQAFVATRSSIGASFGTPSGAPFVNLATIDSHSLTSDELQMFFSTGRQLWWTSRPNMATPFAAPQVLSSVTGYNLGAPVFFNGDTLLFYDDLADGIAYGDVWTARIPEPGGIAVLIALGGVAGLGRWRR